MKYSQYLLLLSFLMLSSFSFAEETNRKYLEKYFDCLKQCHNDQVIRLIKQEIGYHDPKDVTLFLNFKSLSKLCESKEKEECMNECYESVEEDILNSMDLKKLFIMKASAIS